MKGPTGTAQLSHTDAGTAGSGELPPVEFGDDAAGRILVAAREILLGDGYSGLTMDVLCARLGMSKKTLYVHFSSKDDMVTAIFEATGATLRRRVGAIIDGPGGFVRKFDETLRLVSAHFGSLSEKFLADLHRYAPDLYAQINVVKATNIPRMLTPILKLGVEEGLVRDDVDVRFVVEYWLVVTSGLHDPDRLQRLGLDAREAFDRALDLFLSGLLSPTGRSRFRR